MGNLLISGPAGGGKTKAAREELERRADPAIIVDFQAIYAALLGLERDPETRRYPPREPSDTHVLPLAEYTRRNIIDAANRADVGVIATNSDGNNSRRNLLLLALGPGSRERVIDPGREVVFDRLSDRSGLLSEQCYSAIQRWYSRL